MPQLAEHQLRVGGIAKIVANGWEDRELAQKTVLTCLVHDMGNIVKFGNLSDPKWIAVREEFKKKYGRDAHKATCNILKETGLAEYAEYLEEEAAMYRKENLTLSDFENCGRPALMTLYADLRVTPIGVVSMEERIQDLENRYGKPRFERKWNQVLEKYIRSLCKNEPALITEKDVTPLFDELLTIKI